MRCISDYFIFEFDILKLRKVFIYNTIGQECHIHLPLYEPPIALEKERAVFSFESSEVEYCRCTIEVLLFLQELSPRVIDNFCFLL